MKNTIILIVALSIMSCKAKQPTVSATATTNTTTTTNANATEPTTDPATPLTKGKVSHQYKTTGCGTVVLVIKDGVLLTLIPSVPLPEKLDVDGQEILFDYLPLRMHNPEGCNTGFPAAITNLKPVN